jgi:hypothetical protein
MELETPASLQRRWHRDRSRRLAICERSLRIYEGAGIEFITARLNSVGREMDERLGGEGEVRLGGAPSWSKQEDGLHHLVSNAQVCKVPTRAPSAPHNLGVQ